MSWPITILVGIAMSATLYLWVIPHVFSNYQLVICHSAPGEHRCSRWYGAEYRDPSGRDGSGNALLRFRPVPDSDLKGRR
jgi:hypothetical protein